MIASIEKILLLRPYVILILLVVFAFANTLQNSFVYDDTMLIVKNPKIDLSLKEVPTVFTKPLWKMAGVSEVRQVSYRPIASLFYILNYKLWGLNPSGFHLTSIILHLLSALILYSIGLILFNNARLISLIAASIFAVHPVHHEPMGVSAAGDIIYGFLIIMTIYFFLKEKQYLSWFTFFLAVFSKEAAIMLPFALLILTTGKKGLKKGIIEIVPYWVITAIYLVLRTMMVDTLWGRNTTQSLFTQILTMAVATLAYIRLLFIPYPLNPYYPARWYSSVFDPKVLTALVILSLILLLAFKIRKDRVMLFLLVFPFFMLAPAISIVNSFPLGTELAYIADRQLYVPLMSFSLFISVCIVKLAGGERKKTVVIGWLSVITVLLALTVSSNTTWKNNIALYTKIIQASPDAAFAHNNLGNAYYAKGLKNEAFKEYKTAVKLKPYDIVFHQNLGEFYYLQGELNKALQEFDSALKPMPDAHKFDNVHSKQGAIKQTDINKIFWEYQPYFANTHFNLGRVYLAQGDIDKAIRKFKITLVLKPDFAEAHYNLGTAYQKQGRFSDAIKEYQEALKFKPDYPEARNKLEILNK